MMVVFLASVLIYAMGVTSWPCPHDEISGNVVDTYDFPFVSRSEWHARERLERQSLKISIPYVVIHHSYSPPACTTSEECAKAMRSMQNYHMDDKKWVDIGYNFAVGGDGSAYEGRGWDVLGAHALHFNNVSLGICLIGDWSDDIPPPQQVKTAKALIATGVKLGYISSDYKLVGHRQVRATRCPGETFFKALKNWDNYSEYPASVEELKYVKELPESVKALLEKNSSVAPEVIYS